MTPPESKSPAFLPPPLATGTLLAGRFRIDSFRQAGGTGIAGGADMRLGERPVVVAVTGLPFDAVAPIWQQVRHPSVAALVDIVPLARGAAAVFAMDDDRVALRDETTLTREQRAELLAELASLLETVRREGQMVRFAVPEALFVEGLRARPRLRAIPLPAREGGAGLYEEEAAAFARLVAERIVGLAYDAAPERIAARAGAQLGPLLAALLRGGSAAAVEATTVAAALDVSGSGLLPVLSTTSTPVRGLQSEWQARVEMNRRRSRVELLAMLAVAVFAGFVLLPLLGADEPYREETEYASETEVESALGTAAGGGMAGVSGLTGIEPIEAAADPSTFRQDGPSVRTYRVVRFDGPAPSVYGELSDASPDLGAPHFRVVRDLNDRIIRVEQYDYGQHFERFVTLWYDASGRVVRRSEYSSAGAPLEDWEFDHEASEFRARLHSGALLFPPCEVVAYAAGEDGRFRETRCRGADGEELPFADGSWIRRDTYTGTGPVASSDFLDRTGSRVLTNDGYSRIEFQYDASGRQTERRYFSAQLRPIYAGAYRVHRVATDYRGAQGEVITLFGTEDAPALGSYGWHELSTRRDERGYLVDRSTYLPGGVPVAPGGSSVALTSYVSDSRGHVWQESWYSVDGWPVGNALGIWRTEYVRDAHGNVLRECDFSQGGVPILSERLYGAHCRVMSQDTQARVTGVAYFGTDRLPARDNLTETHRVQQTLDDRGRVVMETYFDEQGAPTTTWAGYSSTLSVWDERGNETETRYLNLQGELAETSNGLTVLRRTFDSEGRWVQLCTYDRDGNRRALVAGFAKGAACIERVWSGADLRRIVYTGVNDEPVLAEFAGSSMRAYIIENFHGLDGELDSQSLLDIDGRTVLEWRNCTTARTCIAASGWNWHTP